MIKIAPSILASDFAQLGDQVRQAEAAGANYIHVDVMDGHFVPNITIGIPVVRALRPVTALPLDVHLMIEQPERFIDDFVAAGADIITVHVETCPHLHRVVSQIKETGTMAGVALNPATSLTLVEPMLDDVDQVLVMTVNPGFGGQRFIESMVPKITQLRQLLDTHQRRAEIEVDGGIDPETAPRVVTAGADILVAGSAIYNDWASVADNIEALRVGLRLQTTPLAHPARPRQVPGQPASSTMSTPHSLAPPPGRPHRVADLMTSPVVTVEPDLSVANALHVMREHSISSVLVNLTREATQYGIFTQRDVLNKIVAENKNPERLKVEEIMTVPVITISPEAELREASRIMVEKNVRRLPVEADGQIVGIISDTDIFAAVEQRGWGT